MRTQKCLQVVNSCKTLAQLEAAERYVKLFQMKERRIARVVLGRFSYVIEAKLGVLHPICDQKKKELSGILDS